MRIQSPVFGTLAMVYAETGVSVSEGEHVAQVESMKVFFEVPAPATGIITWFVELGEVVGEGDDIGEIVL